MKLFKSIIPVLVAALAVGFTGCSGEDYEDYAEGLKSPGAFFPKVLPGSYKVAETATTLEVPVQRTDASAPSSYAVTLTDESGLFSVPATVSFAGESLESAITVSFDPTKLEYDKAYAMTLTLGNATEYGNYSYEFTITKAMPLVRVKAGPEGLGTYTYNGAYSGSDAGLTVYYEYNENTPNHRTYYVENFGAGFTFMIDMPDASKVNADGTITVFVPCQNAHVNYSDGTPIWCGDIYNYKVANGAQPTAADAAASYYDPATGLFSLSMCWYLDGTTSWFGNNYEYLQLNGFPDYSVEASYVGLFTNPQSKVFAIGQVNSGVDVDKVVTALVAAATEDAAIDAVIKGEVADVQEVAGAQPVTVQYPVSDSGKYYVVAVSYSPDGKAQNGSAAVAKITLGDSEWESLGQGIMQDGWIIPGYLKNPSAYVEMTFPVEVAKSKEREGVYALINPWGENNPLTQAGLNTLDGTAAVEFTLDGSYVSFIPQMSGFDDSEGEFMIMNREGSLEEANPGVSHAAIMNFMKQNGLPLSSYEDGVISVPLCLWSQNGGESLYAWTINKATGERPETLIQMPDASAAAVAKAKAKNIAAPKIKGLVSHIKSSMKLKSGKCNKRIAFQRAN